MGELGRGDRPRCMLNNLCLDLEVYKLAILTVDQSCDTTTYILNSPKSRGIASPQDQNEPTAALSVMDELTKVCTSAFTNILSILGRPSVI